MFETIAEVADPAIARVLITALKAHGFHPLDGAGDGLPGLPGVFAPGGIPIAVPEGEADDAQALVDVLIAEMTAGQSSGGA